MAATSKFFSSQTPSGPEHQAAVEQTKIPPWATEVIGLVSSPISLAIKRDPFMFYGCGRQPLHSRNTSQRPARGEEHCQLIAPNWKEASGDDIMKLYYLYGTVACDDGTHTSPRSRYTWRARKPIPVPVTSPAVAVREESAVLGKAVI